MDRGGGLFLIVRFVLCNEDEPSLKFGNENLY